MNGGDAAEQIVRISLEGVEYAVRLAGAGAREIAALLIAALKRDKTKPTSIRLSGAERLSRMLKSGKPLDVFPVPEKHLQAFTAEAKKYGVVYCALREKETRPDGMVDVFVLTEDAPKINRVMERIEYSAVNAASIKSEIVRDRTEQGSEPPAPEKSDERDVDSLLDAIMTKEGKAAPEPEKTQPTPARETPGKEDFLSPARTRNSPSARGLENYSDYDRKVNIEPPSVKEELREIRTAQKKEAAQPRREETKRDTRQPQQITRHTQPQARKPKKAKER